MGLQFDKYQEASEAVYRILLRHSAVVQPLSCDEAFIDISGLGDPLQLAASIRAEVWLSDHVIHMRSSGYAELSG